MLDNNINIIGNYKINMEKSAAELYEGSMVEIKNIEVDKVDKMSVVYEIVKRIFDIVQSLIALILLSPLLLIVSIAIKVEDPKGPVFFKQKRVGYNGKIFVMYKFRSMVSNAEELLPTLKEKNEMTGPMFKIKKDPRVTRVGRVIRKTSIDELPQLVNIVKGEMSLVGPRPSLPKEVAQFEPWMMKRLSVRPGLTCYWQVSGRNNIGFKEWMELDIKYVHERSIIKDIKIMLKTLKVVFYDCNGS